jgi:hypothetical protein
MRVLAVVVVLVVQAVMVVQQWLAVPVVWVLLRR